MIKVVSAPASASVTFSALFELPPPDPSRIVVLGAVTDESTLVRVPVKVRVADRAIEIGAFGTAFTIELSRLIATDVSLAGYAWLATVSREAAGQFLAGLGTSLGRSVPAPRDRL